MNDNNNNWDIKAITHVSILIAIAVIISFIIFVMPFFSMLIFLASIPIMIIGIKFDLKMQLFGTLLLSLLLLVIEPYYAINVITSAGFIGITQGYLIKKKKKNSEVIILGAIAYFFGILISLYLINILANLNILDAFKASLHELTNEMGKLYASSDVLSEAETKELLSLFDQTKNVLITMLPALLFITSMVSSILNFVIARSILVRLKLPVHKTKFKDFRIEKQGKSTLYIILIVVLMASLIDVNNQSFYIINFSSIVILLFLLNGLSFIWYMTEKKSNRVPLRILIVVTLFILAPLMGGIMETIIRYGITVIGIGDMFYDFRSRKASLKR